MVSLTAHALTSPGEVKCLVPSADDHQIIRLINAVSDAMSRAAGGRKWGYEEDVVEKVAGYGTPHLRMSRAPISSVSQVRLLDRSDTAIYTYSSDDYSIDGDGSSGMIVGDWDWPWTHGGLSGFSLLPIPGAELPHFEVTYTAGYVTEWTVATENPDGDPSLTRDLPYDLEQAALNEIVTQVRSLGRDRAIENKTTEQASTTWREGRDGFLLKETLRIANQYRL